MLCANLFILSSLFIGNNRVLSSIEEHPYDLNTNNNGDNFIFKVGTLNEPSTIDPVEAYSTGSINLVEQVVETLFAYNLSDPNMPRINRLAESYWWYNVTTLQIKLREDVLFHDGTTFNASAAEWNFERILYLTNCTGTNMGDVSATQILWILPDGITPIIANVTAIGDWNITISLNAPYAPLMDLLCQSSSAMLSPTSTPATLFIDLATEKVIGTGPFKYEYYNPGIEVKLTRWDNYWQDPAFFEEVYFKFFYNHDSLYAAMLSHSIDYSLNMRYMDFPDYEADPEITLKRYSDDTGKAGLTYNFMGFNNDIYNSTWREVMSLAINYDYIIDIMQYGNVIRANSPISPGFGEAYNASATALDYDITTARSIMQSMGFGTNFTTDGEWIAVAESSSPFLTVNYTYALSDAYRTALYLQLNEWYKLIGIKVEAVTVDTFLEYLGILFSDHEHLSLYEIGWIPDYLNPFNMLDPLVNPNSIYNSAQINDSRINTQLALILNTTDEATRNDIYKNIQGYMAEVAYFHAYLFHPSVNFVHLTEIKGVPYNSVPFFYIYPMYRAVPGPFSLSTDAGAPDDDGAFNLNWTASPRATNYSLYQYSGYITKINGSLTLLASQITDLGQALSGYLDGTYYFIVVAHNEYGDTLSNCISVTVAIIYDHDLKVDIELPTPIEVNTSYIVKAIVKNIGINLETGVQLKLYLDGSFVNSTTISNLPVGQNVSIQYNWTPSEYRTYNLTAYAPPVPLETYLDNNNKTIFVTVMPPNYLDGLYIKYHFGEMGSFYDVNFSYAPYVGDLYNESFVIEGMVNYVWLVNSETRLMSGGSIFGDGSHTPAWILTNTSLYDTVPIAVAGEGDHNFYVARELIYDLPGFGLIGVWELEDLTIPGGYAWYEKSTGILIDGTFLFSGGMYNYTFKFIDTNANFLYITFDHEITVTLDIPLIVELNSTYLINATVTNNGLNDELGVELFLYLNEMLINSTTITTLTVGMSQTIQYYWTPTEYRAYNFTTLAPAVPAEAYIENNRKIIIKYIINTKIFDSLYIKHTFSIYSPTNIYNTTFTYNYYNGRLFYERWSIEYMGMTEIHQWMVDALTRVMTEGSFFGDGYHTPVWIFTSISLYNTIPIAVAGEGDHNFYVARELFYDLPGFGLIEVWELEDLTSPGGIAWYEKSTGILLNGTFFFGGGAYYCFQFVDTNAPIELLPPGDFTLSSNADDPDTDGNFDLSWTTSPGAETYTVYRYSSFITEINGSLTILADDIVDLSKQLNDYTDGTYYFIVVAHNSIGDTLSNCISVTVLKPGPSEGIAGYNGLLLIATLGITIAVIIKRKHQKKIK